MAWWRGWKRRVLFFAARASSLTACSRTPRPANCWPTWTWCITRWSANGLRALARGRLRQLRRAVKVFGFSLAPLDLRQNSDVHERVVGELFAGVQPGLVYLELDEEARIALLLKELASPRLLMSPYAQYSEETTGELDIFRARARGAC